MCVQYRFDDEVKDDAHGAFTPEMMKLPQETWIETFVEAHDTRDLVHEPDTSASVCEHCWSIEGWIHSKRRNKVHQKVVEKLVRAHTNLVLGRVWMTPFIIYYRGT